MNVTLTEVNNALCERLISYFISVGCVKDVTSAALTKRNKSKEMQIVIPQTSF